MLPQLECHNVCTQRYEYKETIRSSSPKRAVQDTEEDGIDLESSSCSQKSAKAHLRYSVFKDKAPNFGAENAVRFGVVNFTSIVRPT
jgi:hypothetical protein